MLMSFNHWKRALALGFLSWLLPFAFSFAVFPLKRANAPLFESLMALFLVVVAAILAKWYFRDSESPGVAEAVLLGLLWLVINLSLDYPMFAYGPMRMTAASYYSEIGAGYLLFPAFLAGAAWMAGKRRRTI
ncbi:MAG TPA: hypothetical protein VLY04_02530 [Bryobacteraceae bacterium]|nr:hypothetical protein [Bryobacteraceae bacterium]